MPSFICSNCVMHLSIATSFKDQCLKSDAQLREALLISDEKDTGENAQIKKSVGVNVNLTY